MGRGCGRLHFYPRSPCGERPGAVAHGEGKQQPRFLSTLSLRRATLAYRPGLCYDTYFYPRSPCGERRNPGRVGAALCRFLSTLSLRRATAPQGSGRSRGVFLSTLSLRRATEIFLAQNFRHSISIHALLAESDFPGIVQLGFHPHFYPRSPCGERQCRSMSADGFARISIHALLAESDRYTNGEECIELLFLSTLSLRRATTCGERLPCASWISIHALLAESDTGPATIQAP